MAYPICIVTGNWWKELVPWILSKVVGQTGKVIANTRLKEMILGFKIVDLCQGLESDLLYVPDTGTSENLLTTMQKCSFENLKRNRSS